MESKKFLFISILLLAMIFQIYGLVRYNIRLPGDILGLALYIITIVCLVTVIVLVFIKSRG